MKSNAVLTTLALAGCLALPAVAGSPPDTAQPLAVRSDGGLTGLDKVRRRADGTQVIEGTLGGQGALAGGGKRVIEGRVAPGNSPGCVTDQGNVVFEGSSRLEIEIGGATPCSGHDQYSVNQSLTLNGATLNVVLFGGFTPQAGQSFDILNWGTLTGTFGRVNLPALPQGLSWDTSELYTQGVLAVVDPSTSNADVPLPLWAVGLLGAALLAPMWRRRRQS
jgi:hypothetical protein